MSLKINKGGKTSYFIITEKHAVNNEVPFTL